MNYKKIHDNIIKDARGTPIKDRIKRRNPLDKRLSDTTVYVEIHHIIPRSLGGTDEPKNLVELLPEEHIFIHMIRYKIYRKREDALAVRFMLNGFDNNKASLPRKDFLNKKLRNGYAWLRSHSAYLRKTEGWHTKDGVGRISKARKGTMPAKDLKTGKMIGAVSTSHPKVLSGEWVHHSKGRVFPAEEIEMRKKIGLGQKNNNASGLTEEYFIKKGLEAYREFGIILSWRRMLELSESRGFKWIKSLKSRFNGKAQEGYYLELEKATGVKYDRYKSRMISPKGTPLC